MRKKLNCKLKFALAGFGAFALAGVSCVGLASLENDDAIASYAIDTPTAGNPVVVGVFTFLYNSGNYVSFDSDLVFDNLVFDNGTVTDCIIRFYPSATSSSPGVSVALPDTSVTFVEHVLTISHGSYDATAISYANVDGEHWKLSFGYGGNTFQIACSSFDYSNYHITNSSSPFIAEGVEPVLPTPVDYVHDIVDILVAGITNLGQGIGQGVSSFVTSLAFNSAGDGLSVYFVLVCVFGGIALAVALTSKIFMWLNGLGA